MADEFTIDTERMVLTLRIDPVSAYWLLKEVWRGSKTLPAYEFPLELHVDALGHTVCLPRGGWAMVID